MSRLCCVVALLGGWFFNVCAQEAKTEKVKNLPYSSVLEQGYREADKKLFYGELPLQYGLLWLPKAEKKDQSFPLVVFIHGGCWLNAFDISHSQPLTSALSDQGYAVWSIEYRRTGDEGGGWPGSYEDIVSAIEFVSQFDDYPIDLKHVYLAGHSAGGHLALLASTQKLSVEINKVIGLAAISDIETYAKGENSCQRATPSFMGGTPDSRPTQYKQASPLNKPLLYPAILLHGSDDAIVPISHSKLKGADSQLLQGAGHFDWIHPKARGFKCCYLY